MATLGRLFGKVALITGGSGGQGVADAKLFAQEGAAVVLADVVPEPGRSVAAELRKQGGRALYVPLDVTRASAWERAVERIRREFGALHVLVNNAGVVSRTGIMATPLAEWRKVLDINLTGALLGMRSAAPLIRDSGGGSIVNISSTSGLVGHHGVAYVGSKWGLRGITKTAAMEFLDWRIRVNSVHPAQVSDTRITDGAPPGHPEANARVIPFGRLARPEEVAYAVLFLACEESSYITGSEIVVDCGYTSFALSQTAQGAAERIRGGCIERRRQAGRAPQGRCEARCHVKAGSMMSTRIAFVGLGAMGEPMAANLVRKGMRVTVVGHRRPEPAQRLRGLGAETAETAGAAARDSEVVVLMLPGSGEVERIVEGADGVLQHARPGALVIDCSTSDPASSRRLAGRLAEKEVAFVDAPVTRGVQGAQQGKLAFFVGGSADAIARARPVLECMGDTFFEMGGVGAGHATKIISQVLSYATVALVSEALMLGHAQGLDLGALQQALLAGSGSKALESFGPRIVARQYSAPRVKVGDVCAHMDVADAMAAGTTAARAVTGAAADVYRVVATLGHAREDVATLAELWPRT